MVPERLVQSHPCKFKKCEVLLGHHLAEVIAVGTVKCDLVKLCRTVKKQHSVPAVCHH